MATYESTSLYVYEVTAMEERVARITQIITALEAQMITAAGTSDIEDYTLDTGQTRIKTTYRNINDIADAIIKWEKVRELLVNRLNGRVFYMRPKER